MPSKQFGPELQEAMSNLINTQAFFASYLLDMMDIVESEQVPTAGTDGATIYVNPEFFKSLTVNQRVFVLAHEVLHGILDHMPRGKMWQDKGIGPDFKKYSPERANVAMDYIINDMLKEANVGSLPKQVLHDTNIATQHDIWDEIYPKVPEPPQQDDGGNGGKGGSGNGHGGFDQHMQPSGKQPSAQEKKRAVASARNAAKAMGQMPGNLDRVMGEIVDPKLNWKEKLRAALTHQLGHDEATWARPNRRRLALAPHIYMPGATGYATTSLAISVDTSGSISQKELNAFGSEMAGILNDARPAETKLYWTDSRVAGIDDIEDASALESLTPKGGGGTDMEAVYPSIVENQDTSDITCVIFTDGWTDWSKEGPGYPVIVVTTDREGCPYAEEEIKLTL